MPDKADEINQFFSTDPLGIEVQLKKTLPIELTTQDLADGSRLAIQKSWQNSSFGARCRRMYNKLIKDTRSFVRKNNDLIICIDGDEGQGKSKLGIKIAMDLDPYFRLDSNVLFRPTEEEMREYIFKRVNQYGVLVVDEAMDIMYKRRAATSENIRINQLFAKIRKFNRIVILILPNFYDLDLFFRQRRVRMRYGIIERGLGFCMISQRIEGNTDPWFSDYNKKIMEDELGKKHITDFSSFDKLAMYEKYRCFFSPITWQNDDVPEAMWADYEKMAREANERAEAKQAQDQMEKTTKLERKYRVAFALLARHFMEKQNISFKKFYRVLADLFNGVPPISENTAKALLVDKSKSKEDLRADKLARIDMDKLQYEGEEVEEEIK